MADDWRTIKHPFGEHEEDDLCRLCRGTWNDPIHRVTAVAAAPAPLRDAREVAEGMYEFLREDRWRDGPTTEQWRAGVIDKFAAILTADRAARQPDVERLRGLLEEGVKVALAVADDLDAAMSFAGAYLALREWARQAREAFK